MTGRSEERTGHVSGRLNFSPGLILGLEPDRRIEAVVGLEGTHLRAGPWFLELAARLYPRSPFTPAEFLAAVDDIAHPADPQLVLAELLAGGVLVSASSPPGMPEPESPDLPWGESGWPLARLFHAGTARSSFVQGDDAGALRQARGSEIIARQGMGPAVVKAYPGAPRLRLPTPSRLPSRSFSQVLLNRRTRRHFSRRRRLSRTALSTLLHLAARSHGILDNRFLGKHLLRTSPSGGARHPVEVYPQILRTTGIVPGSYYYDPLAHQLVRLGGVSEPFLYRLGQQQSGCRNVPIVFLITVRFARNLWKYRYDKSYAFTLFDVGHFVQTLVLSCEAVGLRCFLTPALDVDAAQRHLGLDNIYDECAVYLVSAG